MEEKCAEVSVRISRLNVYENEIWKSTAEQSLGFMKNYFLFLSREQTQYRAHLGERVLAQLQKMQEEQSTRISTRRARLSQVQTEVKSMRAHLQRARKNLKKCETDLQTAEQKVVVCSQAVEESQRQAAAKKNERGDKESKLFKFISSFEVTPEHELQRQTKKVAKLTAELENHKTEIRVTKQHVIDALSQFDSEVDVSSESFQEGEKVRIQKMKLALKAFCEIERTSLQSQLELLQQFEDAVDRIRPADDVNQFILTEQRSELVHKMSRALALLDWDCIRRFVHTCEGTFQRN